MLLSVTTAALASPSARSMLRCFYAVNRVVSVFVAPLAVRYAIRRVWLSLLSRSLFSFALWGLPQAIRDSCIALRSTGCPYSLTLTK